MRKPQRKPYLRQRPGLAAVAIAYLIVGLLYARLLPAGSLPDETAHFDYVKYLSATGHLPVFASPSANYEAHQPPLWYALAALVRTATGAGIKALRLFSLALGLAVVLLVYEVARQLTRGDRSIALVGAGLAAFLPSHVQAVANMGNDALSEVLASVFLLAVPLAVWRLSPLPRGALLGALAGLAALAKMSCLILAPVGLVVLAFTWWLRRKEETAGATIAALGLFVLCWGAIAAPWLVRNQILYGDPLAMRPFVQMFQSYCPTPEEQMTKHGFNSPLLYVAYVVAWTHRSLWGIFDVGNRQYVFMPRSIYWVAAALVLWAVASPLLARRRKALSRRVSKRRVRRPGAEDRVAITVGWTALVAALVLVTVAYIQFNRLFFQAQARYFYVAIAALCTLTAAGWLAAVPKTARWPAAVILTLILAFYAAAALVGWGLPGMIARGAAV